MAYMKITTKTAKKISIALKEKKFSPSFDNVDEAIKWLDEKSRNHFNKNKKFRKK